jgi:hypothetical protein
MESKLYTRQISLHYIVTLQRKGDHFEDDLKLKASLKITKGPVIIYGRGGGGKIRGGHM